MSWRDVSRAAHVKLEKGEFEKAVEGYRRAIALLEPIDRPPEAKYDLYMNIAEAYRRSGQLAKSKALLDWLEPAVLNGDWRDPLLKARYWHRRAELLESEKKTAESMKAMLRCMAIQDQFIPEGCRVKFKRRFHVLKSVARLKDWESLPVLSELIAETGPFSPLEQSGISVEMRGIYQALLPDLAVLESKGRWSEYFSLSKLYLSCSIAPKELKEKIADAEARLVTSLFSKSVELQRKGMFHESAELLQKACAMTATPIYPEDRKLTAQYRWLYLNARLQLAMAYAKMNQPKAAEVTLSEIDTSCLSDSRAFFERNRLLCQLEICRAFSRAGQFDQTKRVAQQLRTNAAAHAQFCREQGVSGPKKLFAEIAKMESDVK